MSMYARLERDLNSRGDLSPIVVFLAFSIESYLNFVGVRQLAIWADLERLSWRKKVSVLHTTAKRPVDWGKDPLRFAAEVFAIRDKLAHGKPEQLVGPVFTNEEDAKRFLEHEDLQPDWFVKITREWVIEAKARFTHLMIYLGELFGYHESDHLLATTRGIMIDDGANT